MNKINTSATTVIISSKEIYNSQNNSTPVQANSILQKNLEYNANKTHKKLPKTQKCAPDNFIFNKNFGQNFLRDKNLLNAIVRDSGVSAEDEVLEIGAGAGALTEAIAAHCKRVVSFEIDKKLTEFLQEKFATKKNVEIIIADALKTPIAEIENLFLGKYFIIANLPYYITSPLIFKFLEQTTRAKVITIMVQKEVALKAVASPSTPNYGILSVMLQHYCSVKITRIVKKEMFTPRPKVDSAILRLERFTGENDYAIYLPEFSNFVGGIFAMKRKTLSNNLIKLGYAKQDINEALTDLKISASARAETLNLSQIRQLFQKLVKKT